MDFGRGFDSRHLHHDGKAIDASFTKRLKNCLCQQTDSRKDGKSGGLVKRLRYAAFNRVTHGSIPAPATKVHI